MSTMMVVALAILAATVTTCSAANAGRLPSPTVPDGLGVNIHFTGEPARDLDLIQAAGFRFVRMDFAWSAIEKHKGVYDFQEYDRLNEGLAKRGLRALYILDYSNPLYETEQSVRTEEGRKAFARWAAAAAKRYRGRGIIWELWNEPNIGFWKPQPSVNDYVALAKAVFPAIRAADPGALCAAPATSGIPFDFLEECFRQGLLQLLDAVTVHPYRQSPPETVAPDYERLRRLIARYRPDRADLPIVSGEWGYSSVWAKFNPQLQGQYLARELLVNLSLGVPLSIWYDWHDDGPDPQEAEHHFGTVTLDYQPKPAYRAMARLARALRGMRFVKRLQSAPDDYLLLFSGGPSTRSTGSGRASSGPPHGAGGPSPAASRGGGRSAVAAWTIGEPHQLEIIPGRRAELTGTPRYVSVPPKALPLLN